MSAGSLRAGAGPSVGPRARWYARPAASALLRTLVFVVPVAAASVSALLLTRLLPLPTTITGGVLWWVAFVGGAGLVLMACARLMGRLLPLAALLKLTLVFPDKAPSRFVVAWRAGSTRRLQQRVAEARLRRVVDEPARAAESVLTLIASLGAHDRLTRGHSERVRAFTDMLADELNVPTHERDKLRWAALLHDIGKLTVPEEILNKRGELDQGEWEVIHRHPIEGVRIAAPLVSWLGPWAGGIEHHHERFDGSGYPHGLGGDEISPAGRIVAVVDAYETMTSARAYKRPLSADGGREELARRAGTQFDPRIVRAFLSISVGRLWRAVGLAAFLAQLPVLGAVTLRGMLQRLGRPAANVAGTATVVAALTAAGLLDVPGLQRSRDDGQLAQTGTPSEGPGRSAPPRANDSNRDRVQAAAAGAGSPEASGSEPPRDLLSSVPSALPASRGAPSTPRDGAGGPSPRVGEDLIFTARGRIRGSSSSSSAGAGVTERDFLLVCDAPASQGATGWVFVIPAHLPRKEVRVRVAGSAAGAYDLDVFLYSERCDLLGALVGDRPNEQGVLVSGTRFVLVTESGGVDAAVRLRVTRPRGA